MFKEYQTFYKILREFQQQLTEDPLTKFLSISLEITPIDPLVVLDALSTPQGLRFYLERRCQKEAIAAIGAATSLEITGSDRFWQAQNFIQSTLAKTTTAGDLSLGFSGPHFFCSFTFFSDLLTEDYPFPSGTVFLPRLQVSLAKNRCTLAINLAINPQTDLQLLGDRLWRDIQTILTTKRQIISTQQPQRVSDRYLPDYPNYTAAILSSLELIKDRKISKIVISQAIKVQANIPYRIVESLHNLRQLHPDCTIFMVSNSCGQNFIGASPERLMKIENKQLLTDALAGSAPRGKKRGDDEEFARQLLTSDKERREHQFVINFILDCLSQLGIKPQILPSPQLLTLSNIHHLWTPIKATIPRTIHPLEIVAKLHPTPAVAGVPRDIVCREIRDRERFDRGLYAAPLGWIDRRGNSEFIVGIRSALITEDRAILYAGAGIVAGSDPQKELAEIQLKLQALLKALV